MYDDKGTEDTRNKMKIRLPTRYEMKKADSGRATDKAMWRRQIIWHTGALDDRRRYGKRRRRMLHSSTIRSHIAGTKRL